MSDASDPEESDPADVPIAPRDPAGGRREAEASAVFQAHVRAAKTEFEQQMAHARTEFEEVNERIKQRTGRDLIVAILIAVGIGGVLLASLVFFKEGFVVFALGAALLATFEFSRALNTSGRRVDIVPQMLSAALIVLAGYFFDVWLLWVCVFVAVAFVVIWRLVAQMASGEPRSYSEGLADVLIGGFIQLYVPFLTSLALVLLARDGGQWWVLAFIIVAVSADTGAYTAGVAFGRHPMAPRISPKKTWEGFAGAAVAAAVAGLLLGLFMIQIEWWMGIVFGLVILVTATVGDLGESMIKRDLGIKDMSSWLPGHGGVLDRLDSLLPSTAAALALFYLFTPLVAS
ncbi:phosphatidate cytidylyltransferase [Microbacterium sp. SLBN-146]|uniref:phosphatidate cytidylyltransferase n=1 Tax=Microbacterium sp. SLBN-146 TaxID=2768457 RepID=UPI001150A098|nr:phosphatidate cytidylyltransferase [Microbacterium sp. SLBN-146]TQJ31967.1 phosphatidate cytidylyltransferase [Microbacterium sp. SLBN-146]